jgi:hypothetical protein
MTLLEKAKMESAARACDLRGDEDSVRELAELAIAYFTGQITYRQANKALAMDNGAVHSKLAGALGIAIKRGIVTVAMARAKE